MNHSKSPIKVCNFIQNVNLMCIGFQRQYKLRSLPFLWRFQNLKEKPRKNRQGRRQSEDKTRVSVDHNLLDPQCQIVQECKVLLQSLLSRHSCRKPGNTRVIGIVSLSVSGNMVRYMLRSLIGKQNKSTALAWQTSVGNHAATNVDMKHNTHSGYIFRGKLVGRVGDEETRLTDSTVSNDHTLYSLHPQDDGKTILGTMMSHLLEKTTSGDQRWVSQGMLWMPDPSSSLLMFL